MLSDRTLKALSGISKASKQGCKIKKLHKIMCSHQDLWMQAYANIYPNRGAMTKGIDDNTLDGMGIERINHLINLIKSGSYFPKPCRRTHIPKDARKPNGKKRPLGIPSGDDKLIQEVMRMILEEIYEPIFSDWSYGFRPRRSCHTALTEIRDSWKGTKWVCDVDIKGYFDNINHDLLLRFLSKRIDDRPFLALLRKFLKAGYMEEWRYFGTHTGTPQGGIISPILANVFLHELDEFMKTKIKEFSKGGRRKPNPEYKKALQNRTNRIKWIKQGFGASGFPADEQKIERWKQEVKTFEEQMASTSSVLMNDPDFKRMRYVRYADDFLIGIIGSKQEAMQVMDDITEFVESELKLEVSKEKSSVVDPKQGFVFLGYEVICRREDKRVKCVVGHRSDGGKTYGVKRTITEHVHLGVPRARIHKFCSLRGYGNYDMGDGGSLSKPIMMYLSDYEIISQYNAEMRGFANYYNLAPVLYLNKLHWIWQNSLFKTLAGKHRTSRTKIARQLRQPDGRYIHYEFRNGKRYELEVFQLKNRSVSTAGISVPDFINQLPNIYKYSSRTELLDRMSATCCEYCGTKTGYLEVHHVRKLKDIKDGTEPWKRLMIARNRKTLVLCKDCHVDLHRGTLPAGRPHE
ncbi:reverse transcriptase domain-containing protein [Pectobacterium aquaticum]|uniref:reverse transcriptase domain-containing protein n=1 Tax=Pectobacterium aquaticum TaxID=2204145 RepID=UPI000E235E17|nr:RNA-dependent DNA polymerase [Pectobacterium aquaticum]